MPQQQPPILLGTGMSVITSTLVIFINGHFSYKSAILNYSAPCFAELPCFALHCLPHLCSLSFNANIASLRKVSQWTSVGVDFLLFWVLTIPYISNNLSVVTLGFNSLFDSLSFMQLCEFFLGGNYIFFLHVPWVV